jgi:Protein of unknown function (DUF3108)
MNALVKWRQRRPHKGIMMWALTVVLLHAVALGGVDVLWPAREATKWPTTPAIQMRLVAAQPAQALVDAPILAPTPAPVAPKQAPRRQPEPARAQAVARVTKPKAPLDAQGATSPPDATQPVVATPPIHAADEPASAVEVALNTPAATPMASRPDEAPPHYRTQLPPATTLRYDVRRGLLRGSGTLSWQPPTDQAPYQLKLEARTTGFTLLTQISTGTLDAAGVAPTRFTDQRIRRSMAAANFQRGAKKITFSGPTTELALAPGTQDRLSWLVQLAAVVNAEPHRGQVGGKVVIPVVGSNADAGVWVFRCEGVDAVNTGAGDIQALKFVREASVEGHDTTAHVWLDPQRQHLPVRITLQSGPKDEPFDLRLAGE